jgi:uncharacterized caspase-like protein
MTGAVAACAITRTPDVRAQAQPLVVRERLPLQVALLIPEEDRDRVQEISWHFLGEDIYRIKLGQLLEETLLITMTQAFDRLTVVRTRPKLAEYQLLLIPKIRDIRTGTAFPDWTFTVSGSLDVLDGAGATLATYTAEAHGAKQLVRDVVPQGLGDLVRKWAEQLLRSRELEQYAAKARPIVPASGPPGIGIVFSYPNEGARVTDETITVIGLISAARGVERLDLVVNGRPVPVSRDVRVQATGVQNQPFTAKVPLTPGQNLIAITVVDRSGGAAQAVRTVFREAATAGAPASAAKLGPGERWAVVIGIDQYRDPSIASLRYATADAESVFRFLTTRGGVKPANARLLLNQQATQRAIRQVLGDFLRQKALRDDEVIIYYAGHGTTEPDQSAEGGVAKYLVPWDADPLSLFSTAIPMEEVDRVFGRLSARKILLIQDTCFSGGAGGRTFLAKGLAMRSTTLTDRFLQDLSQKEGRMILTASDVNQVSQEDPALGHGIFTHYLLEALGGGADLDGDGAVTVREVHLYLQRKVHERSNGAQTPQLYNIGDMVLVRK